MNQMGQVITPHLYLLYRIITQMRPRQEVCRCQTNFGRDIFMLVYGENGQSDCANVSKAPTCSLACEE